MKKLLALVLALVMTLGLATVGANAAVSDYKDADSITNEEAVAVMQAIGVMIGNPDGNFRPGDNLSRAEAAKIIAYLRLGNETAEKVLVASGTKFTDVPASHWGAKYIEYCAAEGIINGIGNGKFGPDGTLLVIDFAKMLLGALGYDAEVEGMTGADYRIHTSKIAQRVGLFDGNDDVVVTANCTRDEAALYAFNAVKTPLVQYANKGSNISVNGAEVQFGASNWEYMTTTSASERYTHIDNATVNNGILTSPQIVEFGEQYYPGLVLNHDTDDFGRPCNVWTFNNEDVGTFVNKENLVATYTTSVTGKELNALLGDTLIKQCADIDNINYVVDGADVDNDIKASNMIRTNTTDYANPDDGALTEVYVFNGDAPEIRIVTINTFFAWADNSYDKSTDQLRLEVFNGATRNNVHDAGTIFTVTGDEVEAAKNYSKGDPIMVQMTTDTAGVYNPGLANVQIVSLEDPAEEKTGVTLKEYKANSYVTSAAGEKLTYSAKCNNHWTDLNVYDAKALDVTYTEYVDNYGYLIYIEAEEADATYLFLTGYDLGTSNIAAATCKANAIFLDGTMKTIEINLTKTNDKITKNNDLTRYPLLDDNSAAAAQRNQWFTYKESDGVYTLSPIEASKVGARKVATAGNIQPSSCRVIDDSVTGYASGAAYGNDKSVFITTYATTVNGASAITKVTNTYTGIQTVDIKPFTNPVEKELGAGTALADNVYWVKSGSNYVIGMVILGKDQSSTKNYCFATGVAQKEYIKDGYYMWDFKAIVDGEEKALTIRGDNYSEVFGAASLLDAANGWNENPSMFLMDFDADGFVTGVTRIQQSGGDNKYSPKSATPGDEYYLDEDFGTYIDEGGTGWANKTNDLLGYKVFDLYHYLRTEMNVDGVNKIFAVGNTLYTYDTDYTNAVLNQSIGLTVKAGGPVFVVRPVAKTGQAPHTQETIKCATLAEALSVIGDYNPETPDDQEFVGEIAAALNASTGVAQWIVLETYTPRVIKTDNGTGTVPTSAAKVTANSDGSNVVVYDKNGTAYTSAPTALDYQIYYNKGYGEQLGPNGTISAGTSFPYDMSAMVPGTCTWRVVIGGVSSNTYTKP
jgi:hypothetical protein